MDTIKDICLILVALGSVTIVPYFSWRSAKAQIAATVASVDRQVRASVVSANRQQWINSLRDTVAEFLNAVSHCGFLRGIAGDGPLADPTIDKWANTHNEAALCCAKITLLINPKEEDHQELAAAIQERLGSV